MTVYGDAEYPEGYEIHGIDISHYQGKIDWEQLKNAMIKGCPVRFVIIKLSLIHIGPRPSRKRTGFSHRDREVAFSHGS